MKSGGQIVCVDKTDFLGPGHIFTIHILLARYIAS